MGLNPGHSRANSGHLPLGGNLFPDRSTLDEGLSTAMHRTESNVPLLLHSPSLQSIANPTPPVFGELLEQARQATASLENERRASGRQTSPSFQTLEIAAGPSQKPKPNSTWENAARQRSQSLSFSEIEVDGPETDFETPTPRPARPRLPVSSHASSRGNSPRSCDPTNGRAFSPPSSISSGLPPRSSKISKSSSTSSLIFSAGPDIAPVIEGLLSKAQDQQIWALKKLRLDLDLCKRLIDEERGVETVVKLMEPARSWWPQVGCTILQTTAAAANATLSKVPAARKKIHESGGIPALVNLLSRGSAEARSHAATSVGLLAESPRLAYEIGQAGGCAPLVGMLTSATAVHSSIISFQMTTDHDESQAHATAALANLAISSTNQKKIVEAGGIPPLVLSLSFNFPALQAAAAKCLHSLALDAEYMELVVQAGALNTLIALLEAEKVDCSVQAAAAQALGAIIKDEYMAADAIPILVKMMCSNVTQVEIAGTKALADLAQKNKNNRVRIAEIEESIPAIMQQLVKAELQLTLTRELESVARQRGDKPFMICLEKHFDTKWLPILAKLAQDAGFMLNNRTDVSGLVSALKSSGGEQQLALARLMSSLTLKGYSQRKLLEEMEAEGGELGLVRLARLLKSESATVKCKTASALANLAAVNPEAIRSCLSSVDSRALMAATRHVESRTQALRCVFNLSDDENNVEWLVQGGMLPVLLETLAKGTADVQRLAASILANIAISPQIREEVVTGKGLEGLITLLSKSEPKGQEAAAAALWQLTGEGSDLRISETVGLLGGAQAAVLALQTNSESLRENVTGFVQSLAQSPNNAKLLAEEGASGHLVMLLKSKSNEIQANAAEALRCLAGVSDNVCHLIVGPSASSVQTMIHLLGSTSSSVQQNVAGCLGALANNRELQDQIGEAGAIPPLVQLVLVGRFEAALEAGKALERLAVHNRGNIKIFVEHGGPAAIKQLVEKLPAARAVMRGRGESPLVIRSPHTPPMEGERKRPAASPTT